MTDDPIGALAARLALTPAGAQISSDAQARAAVTAGLAVVQAETGQHITYVSNDTVTLQGNRRSDLLLPERPVHDVTAVSGLASSLLDSDSYVGPLIPYQLGVAYYFDGIRTLRRIGLLSGSGVVWQGPITVTYSHGYLAAALPELLVTVIVNVSARMMSSQDASVRSESLGGYSVTYDAVGVSLTADERRLLALAGFRQTCTS